MGDRDRGILGWRINYDSLYSLSFGQTADCEQGQRGRKGDEPEGRSGRGLHILQLNSQYITWRWYDLIPCCAHVNTTNKHHIAVTDNG